VELLYILLSLVVPIAKALQQIKSISEFAKKVSEGKVDLEDL